MQSQSYQSEGSDEADPAVTLENIKIIMRYAILWTLL
jgi:hypothetical protein